MRGLPCAARPSPTTSPGPRAGTRSLQECLRAYYLYYYRSWGGWEAGAPKEVRELYVLKKLGNRFTWAGSVVHERHQGRAAGHAGGARGGAGEGGGAGAQADAGRLPLLERKGYWTQKYRKPFSGLVEHEYDEPVADEAWKQNWETVRRRSHGSSVAVAGAGPGLKPAQWLEVDAGVEFSTFMLDGVKVFAIPDFAYVDADGSPVVVDWKTGKVREGYDEQVLGYALYVSQRYRLPMEKVRASLVYLNEGWSTGAGGRRRGGGLQGPFHAERGADARAAGGSIHQHAQGRVRLPAGRRTCPRAPAAPSAAPVVVRQRRRRWPDSSHGRAVRGRRC